MTTSMNTPDKAPFRAGDVVRHGPTGEKWLLACDQDGDSVTAAGWPETRAKAAHCELLNRATDAERLEMLERVARPRGGSQGDPSYRRSLAASQLASEARNEGG